MKFLKSLLIILLLILTSCSDNNTGEENIIFDDFGEPFFVEETIRQVDKINPLKVPNGTRGTNEMVIYTAHYGTYTQTNEWGVEAIIENGVVVSIGGNNSAIPDSGMVISGHGTAADWILKNISIGDKIELSGTTLKVVVSENSIVQRGQLLIQNGKTRMETISHPSVSSAKLEEIEKDFKNKVNLFVKAKQKADSSKVKQLAEETLLLAKDYYYHTFPSLPDHERAAWIEIHGMSKEKLEDVFRDLADIGFNALCPEVIYRGWTIFPEAPCGMSQYPGFEGRDPLQEMIDLGKQYDIKIIPWVWVYFVGVDMFPVLINARSEWLALSRTGKHPSQAEAGFHYFCPSRPEVLDFWLEIYQYMFSKYDLHDLQLDYIRYPGEPPGNDYCYCNVCREKFRSQNGVDPLNITPKQTEIWAKWDLFRQENVNRFVQAVSEKFPHVNLSAAVVPDRETSLFAKKQDWGKWLNNNWLKTAYIMSYTSDVERVANDIDYMNNQMTSQTKGIVGLGPYLGLKPEVLLQEIDLARSKNLDGSCLFLYNALTDEQKYALKKGPYRN